MTTLTHEQRQQLREAVDARARAAVREPEPAMVWDCEHCGASLNALQLTARYCSERCRKRAWHASDAGQAYAQRKRAQAKAAA